MLIRKPAHTESRPTATTPPASRIDVFPPGFQTPPAPSGALIPREQFARVPVPEGFDTANLSTINKGGSVRTLRRYGCREQGILVVDPKGEVAAVASRFRRIGPVRIINPYNILIGQLQDMASNGWNSLARLQSAR